MDFVADGLAHFVRYRDRTRSLTGTEPEIVMHLTKYPSVLTQTPTPMQKVKGKWAIELTFRKHNFEDSFV